MDKSPSSYMDSDNQDYLDSSTLPWANKFDFGEEVDLSKIFDMPQEQHLNTNIIPSTSELPNVVPTNTTNISSHSSTDKNSSRITYPITLDDDDDYSLSYIYSMGLKNQEINPKTFIPIPIVMEKQGETTNDMILQQPLPKIPILDKFERESSLKLKFTTNQPTDSWKEQENNKTNDMILQRPMSHILTLEKLESHLIKSKLMVGQENGISSGGYGVSSSLDNEFPQNTRIGQNSSESIFNIPQNFDEYTRGFPSIVLSPGNKPVEAQVLGSQLRISSLANSNDRC
ncbi:hypothetical protein MTR67_008715 [Solanum verrucosum]|uniref:Uncharacterized protein n=1 Tax=Solanum verrucosum TaxID=315347 RepID=A0AAF0Q5T0_SOLVR|nr:hypothetical protein MTR67_008715 [Solanum verrucosum]